MTDGLSHDENQHVAAGALVAREGLLPYRDFPHFHTPYLAFVYSGLFQLTDHLLLAGRLFSAICATSAVGLLGAATAQAFRGHTPRLRHYAIAGALILALSSRVFSHTTGHAWNNEPALLCTLAAFLTLASGIARTDLLRLTASGLLLGLAIGFRLTYAPLIAPFGLAVLLLGPAPFGRRIVLTGGFSAGVVVALSGIAWLAALAPEQAWFGNFEFAKVNVIYRYATGEPRTMTVATKLRYLFKNIARPDLGLVIASIVPIAASLYFHRTTKRRLPLELVLLFWCLPFVLWGAFAPSPLFEQYFYPFVFLLIFGAAYALASLPVEARWFRPLSLGVAAAVLFSFIRGLPPYRELVELPQPEDWTPLEIHAEASALQIVPPGGRVLTLEPISPLEAGRRIYPEFSTGPFAWRVSPFVEPTLAQRLHIPSEASLPGLLSTTPPDALLLGVEEEGEDPLKAYATAQGFRRHLQGSGDEIWLRP